MYDRGKAAASFKRLTEGVQGKGHQAERAEHFARRFCEDLGYIDKAGRVFSKDGKRGLNPAATISVKDGQTVLRDLTESVLGENWQTFFQRPYRQLISEADAGGVGPSAYMQFSAWSGAVAGLWGATVLDAFNDTPDMVIRNMFPDLQIAGDSPYIWTGGQRLGIPWGPYRPLPITGPGQEAPSQSVDVAWIETPGIIKRMGKCEILRETAYIDITGGGFLAKAREIGEMGALADNEQAIGLLTNQVQNFRMGFRADNSATTYATYNPTINGTALANSAVNPLTSVAALQFALEMESNIRNPLTGYPMNADFSTTLVPKRLEMTVNSINQANTVEYIAALAANGFPAIGAGNFPNINTGTTNQYKGMLGTVVADKWLDFRHLRNTSADLPTGLNLSAANSYRWYRLDPSKFAKRLVAWEATMIDLSPNDYLMATRDVVSGHVVSMATAYMVTSPWHLQAFTVA